METLAGICVCGFGGGESRAKSEGGGENARNEERLRGGKVAPCASGGAAARQASQISMA